MAVTQPFLREDLSSPNPQIRTAAVKVFARNPQPDSAQVLLQCLDDPNAEIRSLAILGMEYFASEATLKKLDQALSDPSWTVRSQAAQSLKRMGKLGRNILENQNSKTNKHAYEAAQYALQFNWY